MNKHINHLPMVKSKIANSIRNVIEKGSLYALLLVAVASPITAQESESPAFLEELVVTATKRKENLLDIAGSVQVLSNELLSDYSLTDIDSVIDVVPNATFNAAPSGTPVIAIRGLGTRPGSAMLEQDVGLFVDGVWLGRNNQLNAALLDVDHIEILKGTQATLYGRNTLAGAVSITSKRPGDELEGDLSVGYELENETATLEGAVSIPVSDKFGIRLAGNFSDGGAYIRNTTLNRDEPETQSHSIRATGVYEADSGVEVTAKIQTTNKERVGNPFVRSTGQFDETTEFTPTPFDSVVGQGFNDVAFGRAIDVPSLSLSDVGSEIDLNDLSVQIDVPLGEHTLTSITASNSLDLETVFDVFLRAPGPKVIGYFDESYDQITQEIRIASPTGGRFDYIFGGFYLDQDVERLTFQYVDTDDRFWSGDQNVKSWAVFGSGTLTLSDNVVITGGLRYTDEEKKADVIIHGQRENNGVFANVQETAESDFVSGSLGIEFNANDNLLWYAGVSRGSKAPGLADGAAIPTNAGFVASSTQFLPEEEVETIEAGFKWQQSSGYINATVFSSKSDNFQNAEFADGEILISSFDVELIGAEIDTLHYLTDAVSLSTGWGLLDGENTDDESDISSAPSFTANVTLDYKTGDLLSGFDSRLSLNVNHKSSHFLNSVTNPLNEVDSVTLVNTALNLNSTQSGFGFSVFVKNIMDEIYQDFSLGGQPFLVANGEHIYGVAVGRQIGFNLTYDF